MIEGQTLRAQDKGVEFDCRVIAKDGNLWAVEILDRNAREKLFTHRCHSGWGNDKIREAFEASPTGWWIDEKSVVSK